MTRLLPLPLSSSHTTAAVPVLPEPELAHGTKTTPLSRDVLLTWTSSFPLKVFKSIPKRKPRVKRQQAAMELLRLLTHGKHGAGDSFSSAKPAADATTVFLPDSKHGGGDGWDEGPFFDLDFAVPLQEGEDRLRRDRNHLSSDVESDDDDDEGEEFDLAMSPDGGSYGCVGGSLRRDPVVSFSPSDDLFFKGRLLPLEPSSPSDFVASEPRASKPQVPAFLLKSAAKLRVFRLGFNRKPKSSSSLQLDPTVSPSATLPSPKQQIPDKFFVKFKADEAPLSALFARESSSRSSCSSRSARLYADEGIPASEAKRLPKDVLQRYISKIKPLYVRISKRYGEKLRFSGPLSSGGAGKVRPACEGAEASVGDQTKQPPPAVRAFKGSLKPQDGNIPAGLRVVCRRLRKSRSASAAVSSVRSPQLATSRRDDSLLEQQDGIQSAIAHCKRSFNRGSESPLMRSRSDPGDGRSMELSSGKV
ncbi:putative membrane-associated kinase regulator 2 isoform X2 [Canna indica]|uniref:Membrane-associated kinase regulator 2 isoform X2 n=1 Tax=Canna indica TaxID=4628 RepID=A0AAQ3JM18_9LILI|nr:putative membrane-associated kinase regulator 2 isoform X2 [Canna indica]